MFLRVPIAPDDYTKFRVRVVIHETLKPLRVRAKELSGFSGGWGTCAGYYIGLEIKKGIFGEIGLYRKLIGAGYFAHELQHFVFDFTSRSNVIKRPDVNECLAWMAGEMTKEFWNWYLKTPA